MNPTDVTWTGNTVAGQADFAAVSAASWGHMILALLLVLGLLLLLAWGLKKMGLMRAAAPADAVPEEKVLFYCRFNREQTLVILEKEQRIFGLILRGKTLEFSAPLPGIVPGKPWEAAAARGGRRLSFLDELRRRGVRPPKGDAR